MNRTMATRNPMQAEIGQATCTEYQMHRTQRDLIDFTEHRLKRFVANATDPQLKSSLLDLLVKYRRGSVVVAWKCGKPVYMNVVREK